jgi:putative MATE family efflux protein
VLRLALPALGEQFLNLCVGLFDTFLAGRVVLPGAEAGLSTSAVGLAAYVSWLSTLLYSLVGIGTTALVARHWGAGEFEQANRITNRSIALAAPLGLLVGAVLYLLAPTYADLQNATGDSRDIIVRYLRIEALGEMSFGFCLIGAAALRGAGNMRSSMFILGAVNVVNILAASFLVFDWGVIRPWSIEGIATGSAIARTFGGVLMLVVLARGLTGLKLTLREVRFGGEEMWRILRVGAPAAIDGLTMWGGHTVFLGIISRLGDASTGKANLAAHIIGIQVEGLTYMPAVAWGYAAATLIGQSLGAGDPQRARRAGHIAAFQCGLLGAAAAITYLLFAPWIYGLMTEEQLVRDIGIPAFRFLSWYQVPLVLLIVYVSALRGAGDTRTPLVINLIGVFCLRISLAYLFGIHYGLGLLGAWMGMSLDVGIRAILAILCFRRGKWADLKI